MRFAYIITAACFIAAPISRGTEAQTPAASSDVVLRNSIASWIDTEAAAGRFSGVISVGKSGGQPVIEIARGQADRTKAIANTVNTRFQLASGDKWFTKIAISQLISAGKVALTDTVGKFLPDYPNGTVRSRVTVEQLLMHRSGLGMYWNDAFAARREKIRTLKDVVSLFDREEPAFAPGSSQQYSNNGYVLLGRIVEIASGMSYYDYVQQRIFKPAGMTGTAYLTISDWPADKVVGYTADGKANTESLAYVGSSAGGGYTTVRDLLRLDAALRAGRIGDTATLGRITMRAPGGRQVLANGGGPGANVEISRIGDYTVVILSNMDPPSATRVLEHITGLLQPGSRVAAPPANAPSDLRAEVEQLNAQMVKAFMDGKPLDVAAHYADNARIIGPDGKAVEGREAINRYWSSFPTKGTTWKLDVLDVGGTRDMVYQHGVSTLSGAMGTQSIHWIGIWRRQPDGQLKLAIDFWTGA